MESAQQQQPNHRARVLYLLRSKHYNSAQSESLDGVRAFPQDAVFRMYNGWALALGGRPQEAIRELEAITGDRECSLGVTLSLLHAHKQCATLDQEAISQLDTKLKEDRRAAASAAGSSPAAAALMYHGAYFLLLAGRPERAIEYADRLLRGSPKSALGLSIRGWIELQLPIDATSQKSKEVHLAVIARGQAAEEYFSSALEQDKALLDAAYGGIRARERSGNHAAALSAINQLVVHFPTSTAPLIEKARHQLALHEWDQAVESAARALAIDLNCLNALQIKALALICRDGDCTEGAMAVNRLSLALEKVEPKNVPLFLQNAQLLSRVCGRHPGVLAETLRLAELAAQNDAGSSQCSEELGRQYALSGNIKDATRHFRAATRADQSSITALAGLTAVQLEDESGDREQAIHQVEFLREVQGANSTPDVLLMSAKLSMGEPQDAIHLLDQAMKVQLRAVDTIAYGVEYLRLLDPDLLLQLVREYLRLAPNSTAPEDSTKTVDVHPAIRRSLEALSIVTEACPGLIEARLLMARTQLLADNIRGANSTLRYVLDNIDATSADAHLLLAQTQIRQGSVNAAAQSLEVGVSYNFAVRERPLFHLLSAMVHRSRGELDESLRCLHTAQSIARMRSAGRRRSIDLATSLTPAEHTTMLLELAAVHQQAGRFPESTLVLQEAAERLRGAPEEGRVVIAQADLALARGNTNEALNLLGGIASNQPYYFQARHKMADIHLRVRKDKRAYAQVFRQLVEQNPDPQSLSLLGDAYMAIQEPDKAIEVYEQAMKKNPRDAQLACKTGRALVQTHQYGKAGNYYREAARNDQSSQLRIDMATLYIKLGQLEKADSTLSTELEAVKAREAIDGRDNPETLEAHTRLLELLAKVRERSGNLQAALTCLQDARQNQGRLLKRVTNVTGNDSAEVREQRLVGARLCRQMAAHAATLRDNTAAVRHYHEALALQPDGEVSEDTAQTLIALAKLYMQIGEFEQCEMTCQKLLAADAQNDAATVMMADLAFRKVDFESAWQHFSALLVRRPAYWTALARLVEVSRRRGKLPSCKRFLEAAANACQHAGQEPGLSYCRGLYMWYAGNSTQALHLFNAARRDSEWGQQAVHNMIEICLDPEGSLLGDELMGSSEDRSAALATAERLFSELQGNTPDEEMSQRLLANNILLARGTKQHIEKAVQDLTSIVTTETESRREPVGALLGLARGLLMQKQTQRARNQLKRIARTPWSVEQATALEKAWLQLSDLYIQQGKQEPATELLRRVLEHNQGCTKAYEYLGFAAEKESQYREAAVHYERAWRLAGDRDIAPARNNPALGYKLAFNYMKSKQYADAIDTCQQVLQAHPDYPRIRKEILEKSRSNLRT